MRSETSVGLPASRVAPTSAGSRHRSQGQDPTAKKIVYNMYRDMLRTYNDRANEILDTKPASCLTEDRGIVDRVESMLRQTSNVSGGDSPHSPECAVGGSPAPPPPPPPPLALGAVPAVRLKSEIPERRPEPPACVQNAMMTKDKKPFTYTPGGLDLSQIRSPRMARRITRNAAAEGVAADASRQPQPPPGPLPPSALAAMQPNLPVQVFPTGGPPAPPPPPPMGQPMPPPPPPMNQSAPANKAPSPPKPSQAPIVRPDIRIPENPTTLLRKTGGPRVQEQQPPQPLSPSPAVQPMPPQSVIRPVQSPQPVMSPQPVIRPVQPPQPVMSPQPVIRPVQPPQPVQVPLPVQVRPIQPHSPEHKMKSTAQIGQLYIPPLNPEEMQQRSPPSAKSSDSPGSPMATLQKAPTPWLTSRAQQQQQQQRPTWAARPAPEGSAPSPISSPSTPISPATVTVSPSGGARVIPIRIEGRDPPANEQQLQQQYQHQQQIQQQQQYQQQQQQFHQQQMRQQQQRQQQIQQQQMQQQMQQRSQQQQHAVRVIPIQVEGAPRPVLSPLSLSNEMGSPDVMGAPQSPAFRMLQRVTSRDEEIHAQPAVDHSPVVGHSYPADQMRKMQLSNDDRALMNRFKAQVTEEARSTEEENPRYRGGHIPSRLFRMLDESVDEDSFLHNEVDPRYRGAAIPSRSFRILQSMTDAAAAGDPTSVPRSVMGNRGPPQPGRQNQARTPEAGEGGAPESQQYIPPSEQKVQEPRKYTGGAIPSRSFQMLQAMVAPENCANTTQSDENNANYPYDQCPYPWGYDMYPPYCYDPYWGYYAQDYPYPESLPSAENTTDDGTETPQEQNDEIPPTEGDESQTEGYPPMPYWDPYYGYYAAYYGYYPPPVYSPYPFYPPPSDTEDYSSDEMAYYGARFPPGLSAPCGHISAPPQPTPTPQLSSDKEVEELCKPQTETDTEVENISTNDNENFNRGLQAIRSVSDIQVYNETPETPEVTYSETDENDEEDEDYEVEEEESTEEEEGEDDSDHLPHQLSVIFEESEMSDAERLKRETSIATTVSEDDSSTTIGGGNCDGEIDDSCDEEPEASVTVRLPLKLKFGRSENGTEDVTTVIVGDSEMKPSTPVSEDTSISVTLNMPLRSRSEEHEDGRCSSIFRQNSGDTLDNYETAESDTDMFTNIKVKTQDNSPAQSDDEDVNFWDELNNDTKKTGAEKKGVKTEGVEVLCDKVEEVKDNVESENDESDDESDSSSSSSSSRASEAKQKVEKNATEAVANADDDENESSEEESDDDSDNEVETDEIKFEKDLKDAFESAEIRKRIRELRDAGKARIGGEVREETMSVRQRIMAIENGTRNTTPSATAEASRSSSMKGCDFSEEEGDSGVTSDVSRHTDTESEYGPDHLKHRYQRASTHSRLFKLLQDECDKSDDEDDEEETTDERRKQLSLPLVSGSEPESGICSPASPTWLARELVHALLGGRKGRKYRSLPIDRLYTAAHRILQEDALSNTSEDGSPMDSSYASDYRSYYSSWEDAEVEGKVKARCPRVRSEKNVPLLKKVSEEGRESCESPLVARRQATSAS